jgi:hypothetical protein
MSLLSTAYTCLAPACVSIQTKLQFETFDLFDDKTSDLHANSIQTKRQFETFDLFDDDTSDLYATVSEPYQNFKRRDL